MYDKQQSIKILSEDARVKYIIDKPYVLIVKTIPIKIVPDDGRHKRMFICPIGKYIITIEKCKTHTGKEAHFTDIYIDREGGPIWPDVPNSSGNGYRTQHITGSICWGTANEDYQTLRRNADWFWMAKLCLDLICDGKLERGESAIFHYVNSFLQLKYAKEVKNKRWENKLREQIKRKFNRVEDLERWL